MKDVVKVDDILLEIEAAFKKGVRSARTDERMTFEDWEAQPDPEEDEEK